MNWNYPTSISLGAGRIVETADECKKLRIDAPLIVTDPELAEFTFISDLKENCESAGLGANIFSGVSENPTGENVEEGLSAYKQGGHDGVIAIGGGSSLDAGKAIALMAGQDRPLWDFEDVGDNWTRVNEAGVAPVIAIPTTAGTGSEVGRASVILDTEAHIKRIIFHGLMMPKKVILDPEITIGLPAHLTAATGMDALSHNLEAFCAPGYHPMARGIAVEGIGLIKDWLPTAVSDGNNIEARSHMLVASMMGATAFQRGLGAMHALAHPLGAVYGTHHGLLNAILMPYVLVANRPAIEKDIAWLAGTLGLSPNFESFLDWVIGLREELNIQNSLSDVRIDAERSAQIAKMATEDPSALTNPIDFNADDYEQILLNAISGSGL